MIEKIVCGKYDEGKYDDAPMVMAYYDDGRIIAWAHHDGEWDDLHAADASFKGNVMNEAAFQKMYPGVGMPDMPK